MPGISVYIVSGDTAVRDSLTELIASAGLRVEAFASLAQWRETVPPGQPGCLVLDASVREITEAEYPEGLASLCAKRPVLMLIDRGDVPIAVHAIREGAVDVLERPYREVVLLERVMRAAAAASA